MERAFDHRASLDSPFDPIPLRPDTVSLGHLALSSVQASAGDRRRSWSISRRMPWIRSRGTATFALLVRDTGLGRPSIVGGALAGIHAELEPYYSTTGRPSVDPELMIRMLIVGYCYGIRSERRLCEEVALNLAYRWFCRLDLEDEVPDHSTFSKSRHGRHRDSELLRNVFERVVRACISAGLVKGEGFAVDASVVEADASRYHGEAPEEVNWKWSSPDARRAGVSGGAHSRTRPQSQGAEGDLTVRSGLRLDGEGQQARAVRLWAQLSHRHRERRHRRCRGHSGAYL
jgi:transposase